MTTTKTIHFNNVILEVTIANQFFTRLRGLLFKTPLKQQEALLISPCKSVHTIGMYYAIDVVFLSADYRVLKIVERCVPRRMASCKQAKHTLELLAGEAHRLGVVEGMQLPFII